MQALSARVTRRVVVLVLAVVVGLILEETPAGQAEQLKPCSEVVGAVPCSLPPEHEPGCAAHPSAPPRMRLDVGHGGGFHDGRMIYSTGFDVSGANKAMHLTGVLSVPFIHYRKVTHISVVACNRQAVYGNFPNVVIAGNLPKPRQVHSYQLLTITEGSYTVFSRKYAVSEA